MDERTFEIVLTRFPELLPRGWKLEGQQIGVAGGTLDLLYRDGRGRRQVVELKKGPATSSALHQALRYARALSEGGTACVPWVIAHSVPSEVEREANALGVRTRAISVAECERVLAARGVRLDSLLPLRRRAAGALTGGAGDVWAAMDNEGAFAEMPAGMAALLRRLAARQNYQLNSGKIQTIIRYRGVKLGGVNRRNSPHGYLTSGVVAAVETQARLRALGFQWMEKPGKQHVHTWWQIPIREHAAFEQGLKLARSVVDVSLGKSRRDLD